MTKLLMGAAGVLIASSVFFGTESQTTPQPVPAEIQSGKHVIYFGAGNCKSCDDYQNNGKEAKFKKMVEERGAKYSRRLAENRVHLKHKNIYGEFTSTFRAATDLSGRVTAPTFAYIVNGQVIAADWGGTKNVMDALPPKQ